MNVSFCLFGFQILKSIVTSELLLPLTYKASLSDDFDVTDDIDDVINGIERVTSMDLMSSLAKLQLEDQVNSVQHFCEGVYHNF